MDGGGTAGGRCTAQGTAQGEKCRAALDEHLICSCGEELDGGETADGHTEEAQSSKPCRNARHSKEGKHASRRKKEKKGKRNALGCGVRSAVLCSSSRSSALQQHHRTHQQRCALQDAGPCLQHLHIHKDTAELTNVLT